MSAEGEKQIVQELRSLTGFLVNSMEMLFEKVDEQLQSINGIADFLKKSKKEDKKQPDDKTKKSGIVAVGNLDKSGLLRGFSLKEIADNIGKLSKGLIVYSIAATRGAPKDFVDFLRDMQQAITQGGTLKNPEQVSKMYAAIGGSIRDMGDGLGGFAMGLILFAIPAKLKLTDLFIKFIDEFFDSKRMGKLQPKKAKEVGDALSALATGILKFAGYLALATVAMVVGAPGLLIILPAIAVTMGVMSMFSKKAKDMKIASEAMQEMSIGLLIFTGAILLMRFVRPVDLLMAVGVVAVFGMFALAMGVIGKLVGGSAGLKDVSNSIIEMSAGLVIFTLSLILMRFVQWGDIIKAVAVIGVFALFTYFLGESKDAQQGAVAFAIISVSMMLLAFSIKMYESVEWDTIAKAGAALAGVTAAVFVVGIQGKTALIGSIAVIVMAASIGVLAFTLKTWQDNQITDDTLIRVGLAIAGITASLVILGLAGPVVMIGAVALMLVAVSFSFSFSLLTKSLATFKATGWKEEDSDAMSSALVAIPRAMTQGFIAGGGPLLMLSVPALMATSLAVYPIVKALDMFKKSGVTVADSDAAGSVIAGFIGAVRAPIEEIGKGGGLFSDTDFENGIEAIDGLGSLVAEIAKGVLAASKLEYKSLDGKIVKIKPEDFVKVGTNVSSMIDALKKPIVEIGSNSRPMESKGLLGMLGMSMLLPDDNDFRQGMLAVSGIGSLISEIAKGVLEMAKSQYKDAQGVLRAVTPGDYAKVGKNVTDLINAIKTPISEFGMAAAEADTGIFGSIFGNAFVAKSMPADAYFRQGMEAVGGIGALISGIATGVKDLASGQFPDPKDPSGKKKMTALEATPRVAEVVKNMIYALADPISQIGKESEESGTGVLGWIFGDTVASSVIRTPKYAYFKEGMEALGGLGSLLTGLANAVKTFGSGYLPDPRDPSGKTYIDIVKQLPRMSSVFSMMITGLKEPISKMGEMDEDVLEDATDNMKSVSKIVGSMGGAITTASTALAEYAKVKTFDKDIVNAMTSINKASVALFANGAFSVTANTANFERMVGGVVKIAGVSDKLVSVAVSLKSISESLVRVFDSLRDVVDTKIQAVADLLDNLVEVDKIDAESLDKKVSAYREYIKLVENMNDKTIENMQKLQSSNASMSESTTNTILEAFAGLEKTNNMILQELRNISRNTYHDPNAPK